MKAQGRRKRGRHKGNESIREEEERKAFIRGIKVKGGGREEGIRGMKAQGRRKRGRHTGNESTREEEERKA